MTRICLYGAGAIGGYIGAQLMRAGNAEVTLIARGPHLDAMQQRGLTLRIEGDEFTTWPTATDDPAQAGSQDYVIITLKAHSVPGIVDRLAPLLDPETAVVTAMNGIPWWYSHTLDGWNGPAHIESVDPGGAQWRAIGPERAIGCAPWPSAEVVEPGIIQHEYGNRMSLGEPSGERSDRVKLLGKLLTEAGLRAPVSRDIRSEIWVKLLGNLAFNPISVLTHATLDTIATDPSTRSVVEAMMLEARAVGERLGARFSMSVDKRINAAAEVGAHKTSMLQDLERGRPLEVDALVGAVIELARRVDLPTPTIDVVHALVMQRASEAELAS